MKSDVVRLRNVWREGEGEIEDRRRIIALAALGLIDFAVITLYQTGTIESLPDLPFKVFDSDAVNASRKAFATGFPDGTSGALLYSLTALCASVGGDVKTGRKKIFDHALLILVMIGAGAGLQYLYDMSFKQRKICLYCVSGAVLNLSMIPLAARYLNRRAASL